MNNVQNKLNGIITITESRNIVKMVVKIKTKFFLLFTSLFDFLFLKSKISNFALSQSHKKKSQEATDLWISGYIMIL
jgi:hypothetical protein